jgi:hypothetical protein
LISIPVALGRKADQGHGRLGQRAPLQLSANLSAGEICADIITKGNALTEAARQREKVPILY